MDELHDTFVQQDPMTGKTLLYIAGGFDSGFHVFDVSDPANPVGPRRVGHHARECEQHWYSHTIDVTTVNGRRIVTMPVELIDFFGDQGDEDDPPYQGVVPQSTPQDDNDQGQGCGKLAGNGDFNGPLFIVDATDFSKLGTNDPTDSEGDEEASDMKAKSEASLHHRLVERRAPRRRRADLLAAQPADRRRPDLPVRLPRRASPCSTRRRPSAGKQRPPARARRHRSARAHDPADPSGPPDRPPPTSTSSRPSSTSVRRIWDMQWHKGHVLAADMVGGFYALKYDGQGEDHRSTTRRRRRSS